MAGGDYYPKRERRGSETPASMTVTSFFLAMLEWLARIPNSACSSLIDRLKALFLAKERFIKKRELNSQFSKLVVF